MSPQKIALVTGASRGIGAATALRLSELGFDVAITARTVHEGERREHSSTVKHSDDRPLPGSLSSTAARIAGRGGNVLPVAADLLDRGSLIALVEQVQSEWGPISVLVNNARYVGPGQLDDVLDTPLDVLDVHLEANVMAPLVLVKAVLPGMLQLGGGRIINLSSDAGAANPPARAGAGGWGMGYAISKGAFNRIAGIVSAEFGDRGVVAVNVTPGFVPTERMKLESDRFGVDLTAGNSARVPAIAIGWIASHDDAVELNGETIDAPAFCAARGLSVEDEELVDDG